MGTTEGLDTASVSASLDGDMTNPTLPYGPCSADVERFLARVPSLSAAEIVGLAHVRALTGETESRNEAIDILALTSRSLDRESHMKSAADDAMRMTWLASNTEIGRPLFVRAHLVSHGPAFHAAIRQAANLAAVAAMVAALGDRLDPNVAVLLTTPWARITDASSQTKGYNA